MDYVDKIRRFYRLILHFEETEYFETESLLSMGTISWCYRVVQNWARLSDSQVNDPIEI